MKLQVISDLHVDFCKYPYCNDNNADVLIIAGDTGNGGFAINHMLKSKLFDMYQHIIMVPGNHEYYTKKRMSSKYKKYKKDPLLPWVKLSEAQDNFHFLMNETVELDGVVFYGGIMWTSLKNGDPLFELQVKQSMNDFKYVSVSNVKQQHNEFKLNFPDKVDVVISHHAPSFNSIAEEYKSDLLTPAYYEDMHEYLGKTNLWVHGHVHHTNDYIQNGCRVVSNPRGYYQYQKDQNPDFDPNIIFYVEKG